VPVGYKLYERPDSPFWWVYFSIRGEPYRLSTGVPIARRADAEEKAARLLVEKYEARDCAPVPEAIRQLDLTRLSEMWVEELEKDRPAKFVERISTDLIYILDIWKRPEAVTSEAWESVTWCPATKTAGTLHRSKKGPLKWRSIAHLANTLRHLLRFCASKGAIVSVPEIKSPPTKLQKAERSTRKALDAENREKFLTALVELGEEFANRVYTTLFETWVRQSTCEAMTLRWIDWKAETITLPPQFNKSGKEKVIDLTPRAAAAIKAQLAANAACRKPGEPVPIDEPIFGKFDFHQAKTRKRVVDGKEIERQDGGVFGRACRKAGIDTFGLTPHHSTRHSSLTIAGGKPGATLAGLMKQAGIDSARIIEEHYLHPTLEDARRVTRS
jgi:integrase